MSKGRIYPSEKATYRDVETGAVVHRLTDYLGHSNHLYFTHRPCYAGGRKMLFQSDRENARNLFGLDLESGEIQQLTDFRRGDEGPGLFTICVSPVRDEAYFWAGKALRAIDLADLSERVIWKCPDGLERGTPDCTSDGRFVCFALRQDLSAELPKGVSGREYDILYLNARPHCQILRVPVDGGEAEVIWEEDYCISHVNTSPTMPNILTFCHEGPWSLVDHRIWGLDADSKSVWRIRVGAEDNVVGHEYWFADGTRVGYHAPRSRALFIGHADYLGRDHVDFPISRASMHFHGLDSELVVGDGSAADPYLMLWRWNGSGYDGALLCRHGCSFHAQQLHVHPQMTPDRKGVVFTSDMNGYGNIYLVEIPEFESLPGIG